MLRHSNRARGHAPDVGGELSGSRNRDRFNPIISRRFDQLIREAVVEIVPVTPAHVRIAREAYRDFGKGLANKAQLNFGDCLAYSLAYTTGQPLLFTGLDLAHTGIESA